MLHGRGGVRGAMRGRGDRGARSKGARAARRGVRHARWRVRWRNGERRRPQRLRQMAKTKTKAVAFSTDESGSDADPGLLNRGFVANSSKGARKYGLPQIAEPPQRAELRPAPAAGGPTRGSLASSSRSVVRACVMASRAAVALAPPAFATRARLGFRARVGGRADASSGASALASPRLLLPRRARGVVTRAGSGDGRHSRSKLREKEERRWDRESDRESASSKNGDKLVKVDDGAVTVDFKNAGKEVRSLGTKIKRAHKKAVKKLTKKVDAAVSGFANGGNKPATFRTARTSAQPTGYYGRSGVGYAAAPPWLGGLLGWAVLFAAAWAVTKVFGLGGGSSSNAGGGFRLPSFGSGGGKRKRPKGSGPGRWVTDRSLGGREVWVEDKYAVGRGARGNALAEDLAYVDPQRSEAAAKARAKEEAQLKKAAAAALEAREPEWWRRPSPGYCPPAQRESRMRVAKSKLATLSSKRVGGVEYTAADIADLRDACASANASVAEFVRPSSAATGIFKAAIEYALDACKQRTSTGVVGEPRTFLSGLSEDVGVPPGKAGRLVNAAVAARLRSDLLQAAAQKRQGEEGQAMFTLDGAIGVLSTFPPAENAAEMEMVAAGLRPRLSEAERVWLSETFRNIGGGSVANAVDEALDVKRR